MKQNVLTLLHALLMMVYHNISHSSMKNKSELIFIFTQHKYILKPLDMKYNISK